MCPHQFPRDTISEFGLSEYSFQAILRLRPAYRRAASARGLRHSLLRSALSGATAHRHHGRNIECNNARHVTRLESRELPRELLELDPSPRHDASTKLTTRQMGSPSHNTLHRRGVPRFAMVGQTRARRNATPHVGIERRQADTTARTWAGGVLLRPCCNLELSSSELKRAQASSSVSRTAAWAWRTRDASSSRM